MLGHIRRAGLRLRHTNHATQSWSSLAGVARIRLPGGAAKTSESATLGPLSAARRLITIPTFDAFKLNELRTAIRATGGTDERKLNEYIRTLANVSPKDAIVEIERGWESSKLPVNETLVREYLKAAAKIGKLDSVNLMGLLQMIQEKGGDSAGAVSAVNMAAMRSGGGFGAGGSAGSDPQFPLYIARPDPTWKAQAWKLAQSAVMLFIFLSFASVVLDEMKGAGGGLGARMGMGSVIHQAEHSDKTFDDVVGIDEAKGELEEIVQYLKNPKKFTRLGGKLPKGVLLTGPPGTGKTLLARAIAGEAGVPFFYSSGSEFEEMYVGVGARRVRELFEAAKGKSPCIIFIDEIDAIGGSRKEKDQSAMKMTLNQLLVEMDGFEQNTGVIVIAATNFPNSLDTALIRPGRFDKQVDVPMPDIGGRKAILDLYIRKIPTSTDVDTEQIARGTPGFSGAELFNLVNQAAVRASVAGAKNVSMQAFEYAKDKIMMGVERKSAIISPETMKMTAFHEAGHALVALKTDGADPVHKATIMPRGRALGMVMQLPDGDQTSYSRKQMLARLDVCMGGRVAEEIVYGNENVTSGASSDIQQATRLARAMVTKYGLSDKVGIIFLDDKDKSSGDTQRDVDSEVRALLTDSYARAKKILTSHRKELDLIAHGLLSHESLSGSEIVDLANGIQPNSKGTRSQKPSRPIQMLPMRSAHSIAKDAAAASGSSSSSSSSGGPSAAGAGPSGAGPKASGGKGGDKPMPASLGRDAAPTPAVTPAKLPLTPPGVSSSSSSPSSTSAVPQSASPSAPSNSSRSFFSFGSKSVPAPASTVAGSSDAAGAKAAPPLPSTKPATGTTASTTATTTAATAAATTTATTGSSAAASTGATRGPPKA